MAKPVSEMTAGEINRALDSLSKKASKLTDKFIAMGRGHETFSETMKKDDALAMEYRKQSDEMSELRREISLRYGPGAPSRLPKGFGPIKKFW